MKIMETTCLSDELCLFNEEENRQITGLHVKRVLDRLATLSIPTIRVEALEYS